MFVGLILWPSSITRQIPWSSLELWPLSLLKFKTFQPFPSISQTVFIVCGYNILPKFVNQLIASSIIQFDSRHLLSYYIQISLVYYYAGVFCDIWTLLFAIGMIMLNYYALNIILTFENKNICWLLSVLHSNALLITE